jgi:hypothetical protein
MAATKTRSSAVDIGEADVAVKEPTLCNCGCGGETKGGKWLIGHDMKAKSTLISRMRAGGEDAIEAGAEMVARGWSSAPQITERLAQYEDEKARKEEVAEAKAVRVAAKAAKVAKKSAAS